MYWNLDSMQSIYDTNAPKKATNLTINSDLLQTAKKYKINLSATLEEALVQKLKEEQRRSWLAENKEAIEEYNNFVTEHGTFSDSLRKF